MINQYEDQLEAERLDGGDGDVGPLPINHSNNISSVPLKIDS